VIVLPHFPILSGAPASSGPPRACRFGASAALHGHRDLSRSGDRRYRWPALLRGHRRDTEHHRHRNARQRSRAANQNVLRTRKSIANVLAPFWVSHPAKAIGSGRYSRDDDDCSPRVVVPSGAEKVR
jgi:hypothetical protein